LFTSIQHSGNANQAGLDKFLFGNAASLIGADLWTALAVSTIVLTTAVLFFKQFQIYSFDPLYAESIGLPVKTIRFLLSFITVLVVTVGIQIVGVVLMSALLITPAVAGRYWTDDLKTMIFLASIFSVLSCIGGVLVSYNMAKMPTGPWIVVILSLCAVFSILFAPKRGFVFRWIESRRHQQKIKNENVIKVLYHLGEGAEDFHKFWTTENIQKRKRFNPEVLNSGLSALRKLDLVDKAGETWKLSTEGLEEGKRIVRLHRLWELYLTKHLAIGSENVHQNAEAIEHIITPEIEKELAEFLEFPDRDPHDKEIPGVQDVKNIGWNSVSCALLGCFLVLRRMAMVGDAIAHAVLPGIVIAFMFSGSFSSIPVVVGATLMGIVCAVLIETLRKRGNVQADASIGMVFTFLFAIGVILIAYYAGNVDLDQDCVLHGELAFVPLDTSGLIVAGMDVPRPVWILIVLLLIVLAVVFIGFKGLFITTFDPDYAQTVGVKVDWWHYIGGRNSRGCIFGWSRRNGLSAYQRFKAYARLRLAHWNTSFIPRILVGRIFRWIYRWGYCHNDWHIVFNCVLVFSIGRSHCKEIPQGRCRCALGFRHQQIVAHFFRYSLLIGLVD